MASSKGTFNDYLFTVERLRRTGIPRPEAHWQAVGSHWHEMADRLRGTKRDPRRLKNGEIDGWLGWLVVEWNRVS
jgi:hypothetical protein